MTSPFNATGDGWPYIAGSQNASLIDDYALELANKLDATVPYAFATGIANIAATTIAAGSTATVAITFPASRFTTAPVLTATVAGTQGGTAYLVVREFAITSSGATLYVYNVGASSATFTGNLPLHWIAIQANAGSATS